MLTLAPIVLFVYNRPEHTRKTLEALQRNDFASESVLYIYADGAKENAADRQIQAITATRAVIKEQKWCGEVHIIESVHNKGLAASITKGVTHVVKRHGTVIVLEDDIITSMYFLRYMNDALDYYKEEDRVMHVSAYFPAIDNVKEKFFFYNQTSCWGWATWDKSWGHYEKDALILHSQIEAQDRVREFNVEDSYPFTEHLQNNINGLWDTWAVKWHASVFLLNGLCLHPNKSYTENIGFDGTGTNCGIDSSYVASNLNELTFSPVNFFYPNKKILKLVVKHNLSRSRRVEYSFRKRIIRKIKQMIQW